MHVWRYRAEATAHAGLAMPGCLDHAERQRADRFRHGRARTQFVLARTALRMIAAGYLGADPAELRFAAGTGAKPELAGVHADTRLRFNLSHAGDHVLLAFSRDREVGVDVETVGRRINWEAIAGRYFSAAEVTALRAQPAAQRHQAFLVAWCCKEALTKLTGAGIPVSLRDIEVPIPLGAGPVAVGAAALHLRRLYPGADAVGALATETRPRGVRLLEWRPPSG